MGGMERRGAPVPPEGQHEPAGWAPLRNSAWRLLVDDLDGQVIQAFKEASDVGKHPLTNLEDLLFVIENFHLPNHARLACQAYAFRMIGSLYRGGDAFTTGGERKWAQSAQGRAAASRRAYPAHTLIQLMQDTHRNAAILWEQASREAELRKREHVGCSLAYNVMQQASSRCNACGAARLFCVHTAPSVLAPSFDAAGTVPASAALLDQLRALPCNLDEGSNHGGSPTRRPASDGSPTKKDAKSGASSSKDAAKTEDDKAPAKETSSSSKGQAAIDLTVHSPSKSAVTTEEVVVRMPPATPEVRWRMPRLLWRMPCLFCPLLTAANLWQGLEWDRRAELTTSTFMKALTLGAMVNQHCHDILRRSVEKEWREEILGADMHAPIFKKVLVVGDFHSGELIRFEDLYGAAQLAKSAMQGSADAKAAETLPLNAEVHVRDGGNEFTGTISSVYAEGDSPSEYLVYVNGIPRRSKRCDLSTDGGKTYGFKRLMNGAGFYEKLERDLELVDAGGTCAAARYILIDFGVMTQSHFSGLLWLPLTGDLFQLDTAPNCGHKAVVDRVFCPFIHHVCLKWKDAPALASAHTPVGIDEQRSWPHDESNVCAFTSATLLAMTLQQLSHIITEGMGAPKSDVAVSQELAAWLRKLVTNAAAYKGWREAGAAKLKQLAGEYAARGKRKPAAAAAPPGATEAAAAAAAADAPAKAAKHIDFALSYDELESVVVTQLNNMFADLDDLNLDISFAALFKAVAAEVAPNAIVTEPAVAEIVTRLEHANKVMHREGRIHRI